MYTEFVIEKSEQITFVILLFKVSCQVYYGINKTQSLTISTCLSFYSLSHFSTILILFYILTATVTFSWISFFFWFYALVHLRNLFLFLQSWSCILEVRYIFLIKSDYFQWSCSNSANYSCRIIGSEMVKVALTYLIEGGEKCLYFELNKTKNKQK